MKKQCLAIVLALTLIVIFALSLFFIVHEASHDCSGEDCPICEQIAICEKNYRRNWYQYCSNYFSGSNFLEQLYYFVKF